MTPITRFFERHLPAWAVWPALTATYTAMLLSLLLFSPSNSGEIIYIDLRR